jgi:hypothetical protein
LLINTRLLVPWTIVFCFFLLSSLFCLVVSTGFSYKKLYFYNTRLPETRGE